jgi:hypothetical protein
VVIGDAIRVPTVIDVMHYNAENVKRDILSGGEGLDNSDIDRITASADDILG